MNDKIEETDQEKDENMTQEELERAIIDAWKFKGNAEQVLKDVEDMRLKSIKDENKGLRKQNESIREHDLKTQLELSKVIENHNSYLHAKNFENIAQSTLTLTLQTRVHDLERDLTEAKSEVFRLTEESAYLRSNIKKMEASK